MARPTKAQQAAKLAAKETPEPVKAEPKTNDSDLSVLEKLNAQEALELEKIAKQPLVPEAVPMTGGSKKVLPTGTVKYYDKAHKIYGTEKENIFRAMQRSNPDRYKRIS